MMRYSENMKKLTIEARQRWLVGSGTLAIVLVMGMVVQRSRSAVGESPAFHLGEAGVHYILHVLNSGTCTPEELIVQQPIVQDVPAIVNEESLGSFNVTLKALASSATPDYTVTSLGRERGMGGTCQKIETVVESFSGVLGTKYRVLSWDHSADAPCGSMKAPSTLACVGNKQQ